MPTIEYVSRDAAAPAVQNVYDQIERATGGGVPSIARALAHNPRLFAAFLGLNTAYEHTALDQKVRELAYLAVSEMNGCDYCAFYHRAAGAAAGLTERQLRSLAAYEASDAYDEVQRLAIRYALQVGRDLRPDPALAAALKERMGDAELMELTFTAAMASLTNRFNLALGNELP